jgi:hypothetical protein
MGGTDLRPKSNEIVGFSIFVRSSIWLINILPLRGGFWLPSPSFWLYN